MDIQFYVFLEPDPNIKYYCSPSVQSSGFTYLMRLVLMVREYPKAIPIIEKIIRDKSKFKLDQRNDEGWTALKIACRNSNTFSDNLIVKMLLDAGADIDVKDNLGETSLFAAVEYSEVETLKMLIDSGSNINIKSIDRWTGLMVATSNNNIEAVKMLLDAGANINAKCNIGWTALMIANKDITNIELVQILLDTGADVNSSAKNGQTTLIFACMSNYSNPKIVKMLIDADADINAIDYNGDTALIYACKYYHNGTEVVKTLIDHGADVNIINNTGRSPLIVVCRNYYHNGIEIVKMLIDAGANPNIKFDDMTPLVLLIDDPEAINMLISSGADVNVKYKHNHTFLMLLLINGKLYVDILIKLLHISSKTLLDIDVYGKTAYDYYVEGSYDILDEYQLKILRGDIRTNKTKSAKLS